MRSVVPTELIEQKIFVFRDEKVMLDSDLAELYGVETGALNRAVKRNKERFPEDFMFQLTPEEFEALRCQIDTSKLMSQFGISMKKGGRRYLPYVFTEQGVAMLSTALRSKRAIAVNIAIMRAFVRMRRLIMSHKELDRRLNEMEKKYDSQLKVVFDAIRELMKPPDKKVRRIGFHT